MREVASSNLAVPTISSQKYDSIQKRRSLACLLAACLALVGWLLFTKTLAPKSASEAVSRAITFQKSGRYEKGVDTLRNWMTGRNRDTSRDDLLYDQIAMIYIVKAYKKPGMGRS